MLPEHCAERRSRIQQRQRRLWAAAREAGLDALVVAGRGVITQYGYLEFAAGYCPVIRHAYLVLPDEATAVLALPTIADARLAETTAAVNEIVVGGDGDVVGRHSRLAAEVAGILGRRRPAPRVIGIAGLSQIAPAGDVDVLRDALPGCRIVDATTLAAEIKMVKAGRDLALLGEAADLTDQGMLRLAKQLAPGGIPARIAGDVEGFVRSRGARQALVYLSAGAYFVTPPGNKPLEKGDLVTAYVELAGPEGHWVEVAHIFAIGSLDDAHQRLASACLAAASAGEALLATEGATASAVAEAIEQQISAVGASSGIWHGHGVGIDHDLPTVSTGDHTRLLPGMALAIHPSLAQEAAGIGASVADTYVMETVSVRRLSKLPQGLQTAGQPLNLWEDAIKAPNVRRGGSPA